MEPNVYLVMEHLAGGSVRGLLEKRALLPVEEAVRIAFSNSRFDCEERASSDANGACKT